MSTYSTIFANVKALSKRYDVDDKIAIAITTAARRLHHLDYFWRDAAESKVQWTELASVVDINIPTNFPRFRAIRYVRYWDPDQDTLGNTLDVLDPRDVMDDYNYERVDRYYTAGPFVKLRFQWPTKGCQIGWYVSPVLGASDSTFGSWIAEIFPEIIEQAALAHLYNMTGKQEEGRALNVMVGLDVDPGRSTVRGPTMVDQLKQLALEEIAR